MPALDQKFTDDLNDIIPKLTGEVSKLSNNWLVQKAAKKVVKWFTGIGITIQRELKRMSNSGNASMVALLFSQLCYDIPTIKEPETEKEPKSKEAEAKRISASQHHYLQALNGQRKKRLNIKSILEGKEATKEQLKTKVDSMILGKETKELDACLAKVLPLGTRDLAKDIIQQFYRFARHDLFLKILLIHLFKGLNIPQKKGMSGAEEKKA